MNFMRFRSCIRLLEDIPNTEGYKFIGIGDEGREYDCMVVKDAIGCHSVINEYGEPCFTNLIGWDTYP